MTLLAERNDNLSTELVIGERTLEAITSEIHEVRQEARRTVLAYALRIGVLLLEARPLFIGDERGYLEWARDEFGYRRAHVFNLLKLATEVQRVGLVPPDSSIRQALAALMPASIGEDDSAPVPPPAGTFSCVTADPPWQYDNRATRGAATDHYPTLSVAQLCGQEVLPGGSNMVDDIVLPQVAENAHLYLWTTSSFLREAFDVVAAWGFTYKTSLVWVKPQMGIGNYFRSQHEFVLFGVRGSLRVVDGNQASWFEAKRGRHSAKPERFYELVETVSPGPYLELFGRPSPMFGPRHGWTIWGNEA